MSSKQWTSRRAALLQKEKEFFRLRDELSAQVRSLPWERVTKAYTFTGPDGPLTLAELFGSHSQLIVYHFMFAEDATAGCPSCSLMTDTLNPTSAHLAARDVAVALVSRAPIGKLLAYRQRMGWDISWVSSAGSDFNPDFQACTDNVQEDGRYMYNDELMSKYPLGEQPGLSVFAKNGQGEIFHTYSTYARGLEPFMTTYPLLDIVPKGRDETELPFGMAWVHRHDEYVAEGE